MANEKILLADDEEDIKTVVKLFLESKGYRVITAFDGLDALEKTRDEKPDLLLLDIMMPLVDGFEVCRRLKQDTETASIPIVMLSAASKLDSVKKGLDLGAADYIVKPFEPAKLEETIVKVLAKNQ